MATRQQQAILAILIPIAAASVFLFAWQIKNQLSPQAEAKPASWEERLQALRVKKTTKGLSSEEKEELKRLKMIEEISQQAELGGRELLDEQKGTRPTRPPRVHPPITWPSQRIRSLPPEKRAPFIQAMMALLAGDDPAPKGLATKNLALLGADAQAAILRDGLTSSNPTLRYFSLRVLGQIRRVPLPMEPLDKMAQDPVAVVRVALARTLGHRAWPNPPDRLRGLLSTLLKDRDGRVRTAAAASLDRLADDRAGPALAEALLQKNLEPYEQIQICSTLERMFSLQVGIERRPLDKTDAEHQKRVAKWSRWAEQNRPKPEPAPVQPSETRPK